MNRTRKLVTAGFFIALSVIFNSFIVFPIGIAKVAPVQHLMNVIAAVWLGPGYALACAFVTSVIRNMMGMGSILAFPGSMVGALLAALIAVPFFGKEMTLFVFLPSFFISSLVGAVIAGILLKALEKRGLLDKR
ncbi:energy coupling factor transporter S component ThiW [Peptococcus simiae]|uniref:energy coupling factor transporter S component ThiW n=1 Tax=Peptococcus simiae TaxID=1643805 RepID=UPI003980E7C5